MRMTRYVTAQESSQIEDLANELICRRCGVDAEFQKGFVRTYLGAADAALEAVLARCAADGDFQRSLVKEYVAALDESGLLNLLRFVTDQPTIVKSLGFNPYDPGRIEAYRLAHRFINRRSQGIAILVAVCALVLMCLFPPWRMERWKVNDPCATCMGQPDIKLEARFAGYSFLTVPPGEIAPRSPESATDVTYRWYWEMLLLQLLGLFVAIVIACVSLRDRRSFVERVAELKPVMLQPVGGDDASPPPIPAVSN